MFISKLLKLLPLRCELCHLELTSQTKTKFRAWCESCEHSLQRNSRCLRCGLPTFIDSESCGRCLKNPPMWDNLSCVDAYEFPYDKLLHRFKYQKQFWLAKDMVSLLAKEITKPAPLLLPVPMHWQRQILRGYNHSQVLATQLAKKLNVKCDTKALIRKRATKQQQGLSRKERLHNLYNAFSFTPPPLIEHIALVDDVVSTGATLNEICKLLKKAEIKRIDIYCVARNSGKNNLI